ncbi:MAG: cation:proton antiporter [Solirubrobacterales bacterium]|nr:cation:proton antiporter [Solirubrobacterales bacterium]
MCAAAYTSGRSPRRGGVTVPPEPARDAARTRLENGSERPRHDPARLPMINVDAASFLVIVAVGATAALIAELIRPRLLVPVVVLEIALGIVVGPDLADIARPDDFIEFFSNLGLGLLFFFAGYEIDFERIRGTPLELALVGWLISLVLAYAIGGLLVLAGVVISTLFVGSAMATTAIGTLMPILKDAGELRSRFGTYLLAAGAMGEFAPILLITLLFSTKNAASEAGILLAFILVAVLAAVISVRSVGRTFELFNRSLETSGQLAIRVAMVLVFALVALATDLGLDLLLGGFVAGIIVRLTLRGREVRTFESKLTAVGYGFFIPFFFVVSGMSLNLDALVDDPVRFLELPMFTALFLVVRGVPAMLIYRRVLDLRDRAALAIFTATELPLVVAITTIAVSEGHMEEVTAAALVGAAVLSTAIYPLLALGLRRGRLALDPADG